MGHIRTAIALLATTCALSACAYPFAASEDAPVDVSNSPSHLINPGATVHLSVYGEDGINGDFVVDHNGDLTLPMLGEVPAAGLTKAQLRNSIKTELKKEGYISNPVVSLTILAPRPIYVIGEVKNPGEYPYKPNMDMFEAIALAGGYTPRASQGDLLVGRRSGKEKTQFNAAEDTPVLPGDSIIIRERIF